MNFIVKLLLIALLIGFRPAAAQEIGVGLWCDTAEQATRFVETANGNPQETLKAVNAEFKSENACVLSYVVFYKGPEENTVRTKDGLWRITKILVVAVGTPNGFVQVEPKAFYTAFKVEEQGA